MVTDDELGADLGSRLHEELAGLHAPDGLAATVTRQRNRRRMWGYAAGAALPVVAGGLVVALALSASGGAAKPGTTTTNQADGAKVHTVAYVSAQSQKALANIESYVAHTVTVVDGVHNGETWSDGAGLRYRGESGPAGAPERSYLIAKVDGKVTILDVDYTRHTYFQQEMPGRAAPFGQAAGVPYGDPTELRDALASGQITLVGTEQVDGRSTEHLRLNLSGEDAKQAAMDLWVDSESYLPVKMVARKGPYHINVSYEWLPRTPENLAHLELTVPAGYTRADGPEGGGGPQPSGTPSANG